MFVDGFFAGHVDDFDGAFQRLDLPPGQHEIQVYLDGYRSAREQLYVVPGRSYRVKSTLERLGANVPNEARPQPAAGAGARPPGIDPAAPPAPAWPGRGRDTGAGPRPSSARGFGRLVIRVQPADAHVFVDGEGWQTASDQDRLTVNVPTGAHRVEVRKDGYQTYTAVVDVAAGETATLNVSLTTDTPGGASF